MADANVTIIGGDNGVLIASGPPGPENKPFAVMHPKDGCDYVGRHRRRSDAEADAKSHPGVCNGGAS